MQRRWWIKGVLVGLLAIGLLVPLSMIRGLVAERAAARNQVLDEMQRHAVAGQRLIGPLLVLPYTEQVMVKHEDGTVTPETQAHTLRILPQQLDIEAQLGTESRWRGIYEALFYQGPVRLKGYFSPAARELQPPAGSGPVTWGTPYLALGLGDSRGLRQTPVLRWNGQNLGFQPGSVLAGLGSGIHAELPIAVRSGGEWRFEVALDLQGMSDFSWVPVGRETRVRVNSLWPHPSFQGASLPTSRTISAHGFDAVWKSNEMSNNVATLLQAAEPALENEAVGVSFIRPVDIYQQSERSVKYGFLFVLLAFGAFGLFEVLKKLPVHPVQYGLVGLALALFFLLLLALAEHWGFAGAYLTAAGASTLLLVVYLSNALRGLWRGLAFGGWLSLLFAALYGILISEDNALLMGAILLFLVLAATMLLTRKIDWYALSQDAGPVVSDHESTG